VTTGTEDAARNNLWLVMKIRSKAELIVVNHSGHGPAWGAGRLSKRSAAIVIASADAIDRAASLLCAGRLVAFPTETVYGLGADATNERAVAEIFAAKGRPRFNPLIIHVASLAEAEGVAVFNAAARRAAAQFWPGPLSLVLPRRSDSGLSLLASAGLDTVAIRAPAHRVAQALLRRTGRPVAAPSANRSGRVSPTEAAHVAEELGRDIALILDGGPTPVGLESTVLDLSCEAPALLRPGAVTVEQLTEMLGPIAVPTSGRVMSPGMLASHYAPSLPVRLAASEARPGEALLAFGPEAPPGFAEIVWLTRSGDLAEAAANLFAMLRRLDRPSFTGIAVMPIPEHGLGRAINDRLRRAASSREAGEMRFPAQSTPSK
jgi:L-threonylcarbamoyladenylate synthase